MRVALLCGRSGVDLSQSQGDVIDVDDAEGLRMIDAGQAVPCSPDLVAPIDVNAVKSQSFVEKAIQKVFGEKAVSND